MLALLAVLLVLLTSCEAEGTWVDTQPIARGVADTTPAVTTVSCSTPTSCVGVGSDNAAVWDGTSWRDATTVALMNAEMVSCAAPTFCLTGGRSMTDPRPLVWNGADWSSAPDPTGFFAVYGGWQRWVSALSCGSPTFCVVEFADYDLKKRALFDGTSWNWMEPAFAPDSQSVLSCASASACIMVTSWADVRASRWDGTTWTAISAPTSMLDQIDCVSASFCVGVGYDGFVRSLFRFDGATWTIDALPADTTPGSLRTVSCGSPTFCVALQNPLEISVSTSVVYDGSGWRTVPMGLGASISWHDVSCAEANSCTAVGNTYDATANLYRRTATRFDGTSWSAPASIPIRQVPLGGFTAAACGSDTSCVALGYAGIEGGYRTQAQSWNGVAWSVTDLPPLTGIDGLDVSCPDETFCAAVGFRAGAPQEDGPATTLVRRAGTWTTVDVSGLVGAFDNFRSVSCTSATFCLALSSDKLARWDGTTWTAVDGPASSLSDVACVSPIDCVAVGSSIWNGFTVATFYRWNGAAWISTYAPQVDGRNGTFVQVSCSAADQCVAVGAAEDPFTPAVAMWNGTEWAPNRTTIGPYGGYFERVSCAAGARCAAIGPDHNETNTKVQLTTDAVGRVWKETKAPVAPGAYLAARDVACRPAWCLVVGTQYFDYDGSTPWARQFVYKPA